jgi:hypothetical protein
MPSVHVKTLSLLLAVGGLLFSGGQPPPVRSQDQLCTLATLHGIYIFAYQGFLIQNDQQTPTAYAGRETYDGEGQIQGQLTQSINGEISRVT